jgi:predicted TIM-barrel fold metal-dependent hydrolase
MSAAVDVPPVTQKPVISADSHITEPPDIFTRIERKYADKAPRMVQQPTGGDVFIIEGMPDPFPITLASAAGLTGKALGARANERFANCFAGGWNSKQRLLDQDLDGIAAEVLYPSLGLFLCNHPDPGYKTACFNAYNEWLAEFCSTDPRRLLGLGQTAMSSPQQGIEDLKKMQSLGLRGVMMPGYPLQEDYHSRIYDPFWEAAVSLNLPVSFHILTYKDRLGEARGPKINSFMGIIRGNQDIIGTMIFGGVFERHPQLKICCVEADAGWVPHYKYRMDHAFRRSKPDWMAEAKLTRKPSEYFDEHVYVTFQDDHVAFQLAHMFNTKRMMWANDFPHLDSTWPNSRTLLQEQTSTLTLPQKDDLLHNNVADLYGIKLN